MANDRWWATIIEEKQYLTGMHDTSSKTSGVSGKLPAHILNMLLSHGGCVPLHAVCDIHVGSPGREDVFHKRID